mgnify:CR=1 FL=1
MLRFLRRVLGLRDELPGTLRGRLYASHINAVMNVKQYMR